MIYPYELCYDIILTMPSKNRWKGLHWGSQQRLFTRWENAVMAEWLEARSVGRPWPTFEGQVTVEITFRLPRTSRYDLQNLASFPPLLDILTRPNDSLRRRKRGLGLFEDDRPNILRLLETRAEFVSKKQQVEEEIVCPATLIRVWKGWDV